MIVELPDKKMVIEFPDDMDPAEIERQIYSKVYNQDVISEEPEPTLLEKGKRIAGDVYEGVKDKFTASPEEEVFKQYGAYTQPDQAQPPQIGQTQPQGGQQPLPPIAAPYEAYSQPYDETGAPIVSEQEQTRINTEKELLDAIPSERARQSLLTKAQQIRPDQAPEKTALAYVPFIATSAINGLTKIPGIPKILDILKDLGMDTKGILKAAPEYWAKQVPDIGSMPNAGISKDKDGNYEIQRLDDVPISELIGETAEMGGSFAAMGTALKAGGLVSDTLAKTSQQGVQLARPFFRAVLKGMVGGSLLGEGKKDETLMNMAMFGTFEAAGFALGKIPGSVKRIKDSNLYRKATIKERGLVIQDLETTLKQNPGMSEADLVKTSDAYFQEALAKRVVPEGGPARPAPEPQAPVEPTRPAEPMKPTEPMPKDIAKPIEAAKPETVIEPKAQTQKPDVTKTLAEKASSSVKDAVEGKYKDIIDLPESNLSHSVYTRIIDGKMKPTTLQRIIDRSDDPNISTEVKAAIADMTGDLQETYRYESGDEGRLMENYMDSLLEIVKAPGETAPPPADRRVDTEKRKTVDELTPEEMRVELLTDYATGLGNRRAYEESLKKKYYTSVDVDGLKWVNDNLGHDVGNALLKNVGEAFKQEGLDAYHQSGDEYSAQHDSKEHLDLAMKKADNYLKNNPIKVVMKDGTKKTFTGSFSYGTAKTVKAAERALGKHKRDRELSGERYTRGSEPSRFLKDRPKGNENIPGGKVAKNAVVKTTAKTFSKSKPTDKIVKKAIPKIIDDIKVTGAKDKTIKIDIPKKEAAGLKPKEQKAYLSKEIDVAIKKAPDVNPLSIDEMVTIKVPGDGEFTLKNAKKSLIIFKDKIKKFPASDIIKPSGKRRISLEPSNKRVTDFPGEYNNDYKPRKVTKLPERAKDQKSAGYYGDGFYSNGSFMIRIDKPKTKRPLANFPNDDAIEQMITKLENNGGLLYPAEIGTESFFNATGEKGHNNLSVHVYSDSMSTVKGFKPEGIFNPVLLDHVFKKYPDAKPSMTKDGILYLKDGEKIVGVIMPIQDTIPGAATEARKARGKQKTPSGMADVGGYSYADTGGYASNVKNILELPEIVALSKELLGGKYPSIVKRINMAGGRALGVFSHGGVAKANIKLKADIFQDPELASYVLSHEIGHLVDYLPDETMKRGNILGRMASMKRYMTHSLPNKEGGLGVLTSSDRARLKYQAKKLVDSLESDKWIDEVIKTEMPITPKDVMNVWNSVKKNINADLTDYVKSLNSAQKKAVVKDAMKGIVGPELKKFSSFIETKTGKKVKYSISDTEKAELIKQKYTDLINEELEKRKLFDLHDIMKELKDLSMTWKPFDPKADPKFTKYRFSSKELYADAFSVLINAPGLLKAKAPKFYEGFFNYLERKPKLKAVYDELQRDITNGTVAKKRSDHVYDMFKKGDEAYAMALNKQNRFGESLMRELVDANWSIIKKVREVDPDLVNPKDNPVFKLEDLAYTGSEHEWYLTQTNNKIVKPLEEVGLSWEDFGFELFLRRVSTERAEMGNPMGWTPKLSKEKLESMKENRTIEQNAGMQKALDEFRKLKDYTIDKAAKTKRWDPEMLKMMKENDDYATFDVIKYIEKRLGKGPSASISKQIGTLNEISNPATATILKDMAIIKAVNRMVAAESTANFLQKHFPDEIQPADTKWNGKTHAIVDPPKGSDKALLVYLKEGKPVGFYVDPYIADSFSGNPWEAQAIGKVFQAMGQPFRMVFTELNPGFWMFNIFRDYYRAAGNLPGASASNFLKDYMGSIKPAFKSAYGVPEPVVEKMLKGDMLISIADFRGANAADTELERLLKRFHMKKQTWENKILKPFGTFFTYYTNIGRGLERTTKIAGYKYLKRKFPDMDEETVRHIVRNTGSPDFLRKGRAYPIYNNIMLFSNAIKEGYRGDIEAFGKNKSSWAWRKMKYAVLPKVLLRAASLGLFGMGTKAVLDGVSEYDKTNYNIIPLGLTKSGKSVYIRGPVDETGRIIGGVSWKLMNMDKDKAATGMFDYMAGQAPTVNPAIGLLTDMIEYASGRNPYDSFRGRPAISDQVFEAGGIQKHKDFGKYVFGNMGGSIAYKFKYDDVDKVKTELETVLGYPIVSNMLGRFVKVSDYGLTEGIRESIAPIKQKQAQETIAAKEAVYKIMRGEKLTDDDYLDIIKKPGSFDRNILIAIQKKSGSVFAQQMLWAKTKEEKIVIFKAWVERENLLKKSKKGE